jgi:WD40 repeat protein/tRNA A-37 threonylcarbamoyl transferase component Bud32
MRQNFLRGQHGSRALAVAAVTQASGRRSKDAEKFGRYRLLEVIGRGGMGKVYKAYDTVIGRDVAIKVLSAELADEPGFRERFRREALTAARLTEPHIISIYDYGEIDGQLYLVMPVIDGVDIHTALGRDGPMSPTRAVRVIEQLAAALDAAHANGLVHRDVKSSNAMMAAHDFVYLIDFGIAHDAAAPKLTRTGENPGTFAYMAPENFKPGKVDARADIYALTCVLFECLTTRPPFPHDTDAQLVTAHLYEGPPRPSQQCRGVPAALDAVIARGMAKKPNQRYQSAGDLAVAAHAALGTPPLREQAVGTAPRDRGGARYAETAESVPALLTPQTTWPPTGLRAFTGMAGSRPVGIRAASFPWPPPLQPDRPPYRGWEPFEPIDAGVFFGRDAELARAMEALRGMRQGEETLFVVLGASGAGKSCFLRAGIVPRLLEDDRSCLVLDIVRPELKALTGTSGLAQAICNTRQRFGLTQPPLGEIKDACTCGDVDRLRAWLMECRDAAQLPDTSSDDEPLTIVLPLDQAEELFAAGAGAEAAGLLSLVRALALGADGQEGLPLIVAATIRTDRYELMQTAPELAGLQTKQFDLRPMDSTQFHSVINGPAQRSTDGGHPLYLDEDLVRRLLVDVSAGGDTLPLLSLTLAWLYRDYGSTGRLTLEPYAERGGIDSVVHAEIDELLSSDPDEHAEELKLLRTAFIPWLATINPNKDQPMRRLARWDDLPENSRPLIDKFVAKRLLIKDRRDGVVVVEVALESLLRQWDDLATWLAEERENLKAADDIERAATAWHVHDDDPAWLLTGTRLVDAENLAAEPGFRDRLNPTRDYLLASRQRENKRAELEQQRQQAEAAAKEEAQAHALVLRKRSRILRIVLVVALLSGGAALVNFGRANVERDRADMRTREATAQRLMSEAPWMLVDAQAGDDVRAFQELLAANKLADTPSAVPLLNALVKRSSTDLIDNGIDPVVGVAFANDGHRLAVADRRHLRIWDTNSPTWRDNLRKSARTWQVNSQLTSVAISANGGVVAAGSEDGTVQVWNLNDQPPKATPVGQPHHGRVTSVALSRDGSQLASSGGDGMIDLSKSDGTHMRRLDTGGGIFTVAFDPAGDKLAAGGADGTIRVWTLGKVPPTGGNVPADTTVPNAHPGGVMSIAFSPTDPLIASGGADSSVLFWDSETLIPSGQQLTTLTGQGHTAPVTSVAFSADGHRVVSGSNDETVQLWDVAQRKRIGDPMVGHQGLVLSVAFLGDEIVSGGNDHALRFWNSVVGQPISEPLTGHGAPVTSVAITTDGQRIASASVDGKVWLWDSGTGTKISEMPEPVGVVPRVAFNSVAFNSAGDMVASGSADGKIRLWQWKNNRVTTFDTGRPVTAVALNPAGDRLVFADSDGQITLCELPSGRRTSLENRDHAMIFAVAFDPHGQRFASGGVSGIVRVWDLAGRQLWESDAGAGLPQTFSDEQHLADGHPGAVLSVAFSPDGRQVVSGSADWTAPGQDTPGTAGVVRRWDADRGTPLGEPAEVGEGGLAIMGLAFSPQPGATGDRIFGGSFSPYNVQLWNPGNGDQFSFPPSHKAPVVSVAVSATLIVSGSVDGTLRIWPNPPPGPAADALCAKLTTTMSEKHWHKWVSRTIPYDDHLCPGLPRTPDENPS